MLIAKRPDEKRMKSGRLLISDSLGFISCDSILSTTKTSRRRRGRWAERGEAMRWRQQRKNRRLRERQHERDLPRQLAGTHPPAGIRVEIRQRSVFAVTSFTALSISLIFVRIRYQPVNTIQDSPELTRPTRAQIQSVKNLCYQFGPYISHAYCTRTCILCSACCIDVHMSGIGQ